MKQSFLMLLVIVFLSCFAYSQENIKQNKKTVVLDYSVHAGDSDNLLLNKVYKNKSNVIVILKLVFADIHHGDSGVPRVLRAIDLDIKPAKINYYIVSDDRNELARISRISRNKGKKFLFSKEEHESLVRGYKLILRDYDWPWGEVKNFESLQLYFMLSHKMDRWIVEIEKAYISKDGTVKIIAKVYPSNRYRGEEIAHRYLYGKYIYYPKELNPTIKKEVFIIGADDALVNHDGNHATDRQITNFIKGHDDIVVLDTDILVFDKNSIKQIWE